MSENASTAPKSSNGNEVVLIFGQAGSGKSTLAKALSLHLSLRLVHPSGIIRDLLAGREPNVESTIANDGYWETDEGARRLRNRLREKNPIDVQVHEILLREVERGTVVIDTWSLPWLTAAGFRIKLEASLPVRAQRAAQRAGIPYSTALARVVQKDNDTRDLFLRLYGFDIVKDAARFDLVINTEHVDADEVLRLSLEAWKPQG